MADEGEYEDYDEEYAQGTGADEYDSAYATSYEPPSASLDNDDQLIQSKTHDEILQNTQRPAGQGKRDVYDDENLGEDFEDTPWVPPSIEKAVDNRAKTIFRGGNASIWNTKVCNAPDIGVGTALYFQFVKDMAVCFLVMFVLSIPSLFFSYQGKRIQPWEKDTIGFYQFTIGNIGYDTSSKTYSADTACTNPVYKLLNQTCINIPHLPETTIATMQGIITVCEFLQILAFFAACFHLNRRVHSLQDEVDKMNTSVTDYAIIVRDLPEDASVDQLVTHFTNLYPLNQPDWKQRPAVLGTRPVQHISKNPAIQPYHVNTWVAECTIMRKIGKQLLAFKQQENLTLELRRARAMMKMYADNTPHAGGPNPRLYKKAEAAMMATGTKIDMLAEKVIDKKQISASSRNHVDGDDATSEKKDVNSHIEAASVAACVVFEYSESFARCIEDYRLYSSFPRNLCYPDRLKFRGQRITISKAPEPDAVIWENLEVSKPMKFFYRTRNYVISAVLMIVAFAIIVQASVQKAILEKKLQNTNLCAAKIPELYFNTSAADVPNVHFVRPTAAMMASLDNKCQEIIPGSFYATYALPNGRNITKYDFNACSDNGLCPAKGEKSYCPCVTAEQSNQVCKTQGCYPDPNSPYCTKFNATVIGDCYCLGVLSSLLSADSVLSVASTIQKGGGSLPGVPEQCNAFLTAYFKGTGLSFGVTFTTTFINYFLSVVIPELTKAEAHSSVGDFDASLAAKTFVITFMNLAVISLVAFGYIPGLSSSAQRLSIFQGSYSDFTPKWYASVGSVLVQLFIIQVLSYLIYPILDYWIFKPMSRCLNYPMISAQRSHKVVMQDELNEMEVGPVFDTSGNVAQMLSLVFFAMLYAPGIPLLTFLGFASFTLYFRWQKILICRYNQRPPNVDNSMILFVVNLLPYAAILRVMFAFWMLGNTSIFPTSSLDLKDPNVAYKGVSVSGFGYSNQLSGYASGYGSSYVDNAFVATGFQERLAQPTSQALFTLLIIIIAVMIIRALWEELPFYWILKFLSCVRRCFCGRGEKKVYASETETGDVGLHPFDLHMLDDSLRQESAPYSGDYFSYLKDKNEIPTGCCAMCTFNDELTISPEDEEIGWVVVDDDRFYMRKQRWTSTLTLGGVTRVRGDWKKTYEVISSHGVNSYNLEKIPSYRKAVLGLKEGAANLADYKEHGTFEEKYKNKQKEIANQVPKSDWDVEAGKSKAAKGPAKKGSWQVKEEEEDDDEDDEDDD